MDELAVLALCCLITLCVAIVFWRYPATQWFERRFPSVFPSAMAEHLEAVARLRPVNHFGIHFLMFMGAFAIAGDLTGELPAILRYGLAAVVSAFTLVLARRSASQRHARSSA